MLQRNIVRRSILIEPKLHQSVTRRNLSTTLQISPKCKFLLPATGWGKTNVQLAAIISGNLTHDK